MTGQGPARHVQTAGALSSLAAASFKALVTPPYDTAQWLRQTEQIGVRSLGVASITTIFTGMVLALQTAYALPKLGVKYYIGTVVAKSLVRELGPVLVALIVGGRVGAGMTAEIGTMKVTEQVDALRSMGADPVRKLVVPKLAASLLMLPVLTMLGDLLGILGGLIIAVFQLDLTARFYLNDVFSALTLDDIAQRRRQVGLLRLLHHHRRLLQWPDGARRRRRRRPRHHQHRGARLDPGAGLRLLPHQALLAPLMTATAPLFAVSGLTKCYDGRTVLDGVAFEVERGESLVILGRSGIGKSVLLRQLIGLEPADSGSVDPSTASRSPVSPSAQLAPVRRRVAMLFQSGALFDSMTVFDNVAFPLREHRELDEQRGGGEGARDARSGAASPASRRSCRPSSPAA